MCVASKEGCGDKQHKKYDLSFVCVDANRHGVEGDDENYRGYWVGRAPRVRFDEAKRSELTSEDQGTGIGGPRK